MVRDPDMVKKLCVKDFEYFVDRRIMFDADTDPMMGNSLLSMTGHKWRDMRATLSPSFTGSKIRQMFELIGDTANDMSDHFRQQCNGSHTVDVEAKDIFSKYTTDVIATSAFGIKVNSFENGANEFYCFGKKIMTFNAWTMVRVTLCQIAPKLMQWTGIQMFDRKSTSYFRALVQEMIEVRSKRNIFRPDMINLMIQLKNGIGGSDTTNEPTTEVTDGFAAGNEIDDGGKVVAKRKWNDTELMAQCFTFFLAGFETSSTVLSFLVYELAKNQEVQEKLYIEIRETNVKLDGKKLTYDIMQKMRYMDQVISEGLRMWPPGANTDRMCAKDYEYDDGTNRFRIEKGMVLSIPIYALHHDPLYFPNPSQFDPDRFSDKNRDTFTTNAYLPFGIGPRNCIGKFGCVYR